MVTYNGATLLDHAINGEKEHDDKVTGKVALNYTVGDQGLLYAFVATGHKSGGINPIAALGSPAGTPAPEFKPEDVTDYELGWKDSFLGDHLRTQIDGYYYDYSNFQVSIFDPSSVLSQLKNATGSSTIEGVEAQGQGVFGDLSVDFGIGYLHSKLGTFAAIDPRNPGLGMQVLTGRALPNAASLTGNLGVQYAIHVAGADTLTPRLDYGTVDKRWATLFEVSPIDRLGAQNLLNAELNYAHGDWRFIAFATNLTDLHYVSSLSLGNLAIAGPPRQYGLRVSTSF